MGDHLFFDKSMDFRMIPMVPMCRLFNKRFIHSKASQMVVEIAQIKVLPQRELSNIFAFAKFSHMLIFLIEMGHKAF